MKWQPSQIRLDEIYLHFEVIFLHFHSFGSKASLAFDHLCHGNFSHLKSHRGHYVLYCSGDFNWLKILDLKCISHLQLLF